MRIILFKQKFLTSIKQYKKQCLFTQALLLLLSFYILACDRCKGPIQAVKVDHVVMEIPQHLLIGEQHKISLLLRSDDKTAQAEMQNLNLKVEFEVQKSFRAVAHGSQISYQDASGKQQNVTTSFEKPLLELTAWDTTRDNQELKLAFDLLPAKEAVKVKLNFALVDLDGQVIQTIPVTWIKNEIVIDPVNQAQEGKVYISLQSLKEDIQELDKIIVSIQGLDKNIDFLVEGKRKKLASLADLLPGTSVLSKDQASEPIAIALDRTEDKNGLVSILVMDKRGDGYLPNQAKDSGSSEQLSEGLASIEDIQAYKELDEQELDYLQQLQRVLQAEIKQIVNQLEKEAKEVKENRKQALLTVKNEKVKALKGKQGIERAAIKLVYEKRKTRVLLTIGGYFIKNKFNYNRGVFNALGHNIFGMALKEPTDFYYSKGQLAGHKIALALVGTEAAIGSSLIGVGVFATAAGVVPTLGTIETVTIPTILVGALLVGHSIFANMRVHANLKQWEEEENLQAGLPEKYLEIIKKLKAYRIRSKK